MNGFAQFGLIAAICIGAAGGTWLVNGRPMALPKKLVQCDPRKLSADEVCLADVPKNVLWIDARTKAEWNQNGLKGSIWWNLGPAEDSENAEATIAERIFEMSGGEVVVYCGSEACGTSKAVAQRIRALELGARVRILFGGWDALVARDSSLKL